MTLVADYNPAVSVTFQRMRALLLDSGGGLQEGVVGSGDLKASQRAAGANLSADVAIGGAWTQLDTGSRNGLGHVYNDAVYNAGPFTAGHATLPRVDQVIVRWNDSSIPTGSGNTPTIEVLTGTATSGATLDNRLGATALPNDCMRVADVLMPAAASSVTTANIRDRRSWARGAFFQTKITAGNRTTTSAAFVAIDATNLQPRIECSGVPLRVALSGMFQASIQPVTAFFQISADVLSSQFGAIGTQQVVTSPANNYELMLTGIDTPSAGSHLFIPAFAVGGGATLTVAGVATSGLYLTIEEIVRPNASNT